ncbi:MAG: uracil phosphoribosyltransferase, partial [Spirochaetales bacterium]|nr:uracil phosphoribosyltransferase [Spirochaetales bacterium]
MSKIILKAEDLDGYLTERDNEYLDRMDGLYRQAIASCNLLSTSISESQRVREEGRLIDLYNQMGTLMREICLSDPRIQVYSFVSPQETHGEVSRLIAKLRDVTTGRQEFVYYIQRAFELLFNLAFGQAGRTNK